MSAPDLFTSPFQEPLGLCSSPLPTPQSFGDSRCQRFEFACRGDRVPGRLLLPGRGDGPFPLILFQHGLGGSKEAPCLAVAARWVHDGAAVASIDLPLHGERASAKLTGRLFESIQRSLAGSQLDPVSSALWLEFTRQAVLDLRRTLDALASLPSVDDSRSAYAGFGLGGALGSIFCAVDPRPKGAALALAGGGYGPPEVDPCTYIAKLAPRPLLLVNAERDERTPRKAAQALFEAARDPKQIEWFATDCEHLPATALGKMWGFLRAQLGI